MTILSPLATLLVWFPVVHWTLEGFYDVAMIAPLLLCWRYLGQRRGLAAGVAFCAAAFLHFRAYSVTNCSCVFGLPQHHALRGDELLLRFPGAAETQAASLMCGICVHAPM